MAFDDYIEFRRFVLGEADTLAEFLTTEDWPYHSSDGPAAAQVLEQAAAGGYDNDRTRTFWIVTGTGTEAGLIRLLLSVLRAPQATRHPDRHHLLAFDLDVEADDRAPQVPDAPRWPVQHAVRASQAKLSSLPSLATSSCWSGGGPGMVWYPAACRAAVRAGASAIQANQSIST